MGDFNIQVPTVTNLTSQITPYAQYQTPCYPDMPNVFTGGAPLPGYNTSPPGMVDIPPAPGYNPPGNMIPPIPGFNLPGIINGLPVSPGLPSGSIGGSSQISMGIPNGNPNRGLDWDPASLTLWWLDVAAPFMKFWYSQDQGTTWVNSVSSTLDTTHVSAGNALFYIDDAGGASLVYTTVVGHTYSIWFVYGVPSSTTAWTWTSPVLIGTDFPVTIFDIISHTKGSDVFCHIVLAAGSVFNTYVRMKVDNSLTITTDHTGQINDGTFFLNQPGTLWFALTESPDPKIPNSHYDILVGQAYGTGGVAQGFLDGNASWNLSGAAHATSDRWSDSIPYFQSYQMGGNHWSFGALSGGATIDAVSVTAATVVQAPAPSGNAGPVSIRTISDNSSQVHVYWADNSSLWHTKFDTSNHSWSTLGWTVMDTSISPPNEIFTPHYEVGGSEFIACSTNSGTMTMNTALGAIGTIGTLVGNLIVTGVAAINSLFVTSPHTLTVAETATMSSTGISLFAPVSISNNLSVSGDSTVRNTTVRGSLDHTGTTLGFFNATPVSQVSAITQTYATANRSLGSYTPNSQSSPYTGIDNTDASPDYAQVSDLNTLRAAYENLRALTENTTQVLNSVINDLRSYGLET